MLALYYGHLESMLSRHWPEFGEVVDVHRQRSWMTLLLELPGPELVAASADGAVTILRRASHGKLKQADVAAILDAATHSCGVPMTTGEQEKLRAIVEQLAAQRRRLNIAVDHLLLSIMLGISTLFLPIPIMILGTLVASRATRAPRPASRRR